MKREQMKWNMKQQRMLNQNGKRRTKKWRTDKK